MSTCSPQDAQLTPPSREEYSEDFMREVRKRAKSFIRDKEAEFWKDMHQRFPKLLREKEKELSQKFTGDGTTFTRMARDELARQFKSVLRRKQLSEWPLQEVDLGCAAGGPAQVLKAQDDQGEEEEYSNGDTYSADDGAFLVGVSASVPTLPTILPALRLPDDPRERHRPPRSPDSTALSSKKKKKQHTDQDVRPPFKRFVKSNENSVLSHIRQDQCSTPPSTYTVTQNGMRVQVEVLETRPSSPEAEIVLPVLCQNVGEGSSARASSRPASRLNKVSGAVEVLERSESCVPALDRGTFPFTDQAEALPSSAGPTPRNRDGGRLKYAEWSEGLAFMGEMVGNGFDVRNPAECDTDIPLHLSEFEELGVPHLKMGLPSHTGANLSDKLVTEVCVMLQRNHSVTSLNLSQNCIPVKAMRQLAVALNPRVTQPQALQCVRIAKGMIQDRGLLMVCDALRTNLHLKQLSLPNNKIQDEGAMAVGSMLENNKALEELDLSWNSIKAGHPDPPSISPRPSWPPPTSISFTVAGARTIAEGLRGNNTLKTLSLQWNGLESSGAMTFGEALLANSCLTSLDLCSTRCGPEAAMVLAESIKLNTALLNLNLSLNPIGVVRRRGGLVRVWRLQVANEHAKLAYLTLGEKDGLALVAGLRENTRVRILDLEDGGRHLMSALRENDVLEQLGVQQVLLSSKMQSGLAKFNDQDPNGVHQLDLNNPVMRAIALQLIALGHSHPGSWLSTPRGALEKRRTGHLGLVQEAGHGESGGGGGCSGHRRGADLPKYGELNVDFISYRELHLPGGKKAYPTMIFNAFMSELKLSLGITKPSRGQKVVRMDPEDKANLAKSLRLPGARLLSKFDLDEQKVLGAVYIFPRLVDTHNFVDLTARFLPSEKAKLQQLLGRMINFNPTNPTGHYVLNLNIMSHRLIAQRLVEMAIAEGSVFTKEHCSVHFCLDCTNTEHEPIARELCKMAFKDKTKQSWNNIMVDGRRVPNLAEVESLWLFLTNENATPKIEIDFFGEDLMANKVRSEAIRCRLSRARQLHIYCKALLNKDVATTNADEEDPALARQVLLEKLADEMEVVHRSVYREHALNADVYFAGNARMLEERSQRRLPLHKKKKPQKLTQLGRRRALPNIMRPEWVGIWIPGQDAEHGYDTVETSKPIPSYPELKCQSPSRRMNSWQITWDRHMWDLAAYEMKDTKKTPLQASSQNAFSGVLFFDQLDQDLGGSITLDELIAEWDRVFAIPSKNYDIAKLFRDCDTDFNGEIDWPEFEAMVMKEDFTFETYNKVKKVMQGKLLTSPAP
eukprot:gene1036-1567_t